MPEPIYIIEQLDPRIWKWNYLEYKHISEMVDVWFTNIKRKNQKLEKLGKCFRESVKEMKLDNACILDPDAKETLKPGEKFDYFIFGGIMGDYPPRKRTKEELSKFMPNIERRNIGKKQLSTDNAVYVVKLINKGKNFEEVKFIDEPSIKINDFLSVDLPFRYPEVDGKPFMSEELLKFIKRKKGF